MSSTSAALAFSVARSGRLVPGIGQAYGRVVMIQASATWPGVQSRAFAMVVWCGTLRPYDRRLSRTQSPSGGVAATQSTPRLPSWSAITVRPGDSLSSTTVPPAATAAAIRCAATSGAT